MVKRGCILGLVFSVKLRDHPLLRRHWPPTWIAVTIVSPPAPAGEVAILKNAHSSRIDNRRMFVSIEHDEARYLAILDLEDREFCQRLIELMQQNYGKTIQEIGNIEIPIATHSEPA